MHNLEAIYLAEDGKKLDGGRLSFELIPRIGELILLHTELSVEHPAREFGQWLFRVTDICHHTDAAGKVKPGSITLTADPTQVG